jgi:CRISPR-associated protein Cas2
VVPRQNRITGQSSNNKQAWILMYLLVFYDISNAKRLRSVAQILLSYGIRIQHSVFEMKIKAKEVNTLQNKLKKILKGKDRIHYYTLCNKDLKKRKAQGKGNVYIIPNYAIVT